MVQKFKITTCAFILCLFGLTHITVSLVEADDVDISSQHGTNLRIADLETQLFAQQREATSLGNRLSEANAETESLREQLTAANAERGSLREQLTAANAETASLTEQLTAANAETGSLTEQLTAANALRVQLTAGATDAEIGYYQDRGGMHAVIRALCNSRSSLRWQTSYRCSIGCDPTC